MVTKVSKTELRKERRVAAINALGGLCNKCGSTERLEFDHLNPLTKTYQIYSIWLRSEKIRVKELAKCQLLCKPCHVKKSLRERGKREVAEHGTPSMYTNHKCRCELCTKAWNSYLTQRRWAKY